MSTLCVHYYCLPLGWVAGEPPLLFPLPTPFPNKRSLPVSHRVKRSLNLLKYVGNLKQRKKKCCLFIRHHWLPRSRRSQRTLTQRTFLRSWQRYSAWGPGVTDAGTSRWDVTLYLLMRPTTHHLPFTGDSRLQRDGEFLEKVQQSKTGATEPTTQTRAVVRNQQEATRDAQTVLGWHLSKWWSAEPAQPTLHRQPSKQLTAARVHTYDPVRWQKTSNHL